jgi:hypothetical protein
MWSQESKTSITSNRRIRALVESLRAYVEERLKEGSHVVIPSVAAQYLGISTPETLGLLMVLEKEGLLSHRYRLYCKSNDTVLFETANRSSLPVDPYCKFCDRDHDEDELEVEVVFEISAELPVFR